jgi:hypothetical protein
MKQTQFYALAALLASASLGTATVTYVDASSSNTTNYNTGSSTDWYTSAGAADGLWRERAFANNNTIYETNATGGEDAVGLVTVVTGLTVGETYSLFAYFWSDAANWRLKASTTATPPIGDNTSVSFSRSGTATSANAPEVPAGGRDSGDNLGVTWTGTGTIGGGDAVWTSDAYFTGGVLVGEGNRTLFEADLGTAVADANGDIKIYIDDVANTSSSNRTWYDGVGYEAVPEPSTFSLLALALGAFFVRRRRS